MFETLKEILLGVISVVLACQGYTIFEIQSRENAAIDQKICNTSWQYTQSIYNIKIADKQSETSDRCFCLLYHPQSTLLMDKLVLVISTDGNPQRTTRVIHKLLHDDWWQDQYKVPIFYIMPSSSMEMNSFYTYITANNMQRSYLPIIITFEEVQGNQYVSYPEALHLSCSPNGYILPDIIKPTILPKMTTPSTVDEITTPVATDTNLTFVITTPADRATDRPPAGGNARAVPSSDTDDETIIIAATAGGVGGLLILLLIIVIIYIACRKRNNKKFVREAYYYNNRDEDYYAEIESEGNSVSTNEVTPGVSSVNVSNNNHVYYNSKHQSSAHMNNAYSSTDTEIISPYSTTPNGRISRENNTAYISRDTQSYGDTIVNNAPGNDRRVHYAEIEINPDSSNQRKNREIQGSDNVTYADIDFVPGSNNYNSGKGNITQPSNSQEIETQPNPIYSLPMKRNTKPTT